MHFKDKLLSLGLFDFVSEQQKMANEKLTINIGIKIILYHGMFATNYHLSRQDYN